MWELEEELPDPLVYDRILREMLEKMGSLDLEDPGLSERELEEVQRLLADEAFGHHVAVRDVVHAQRLTGGGSARNKTGVRSKPYSPRSRVKG